MAIAVFMVAVVALVWRPPGSGPAGERAIPWLSPSPALVGDELGHVHCASTFTRLFFVERDFSHHLWAEPMNAYGRFEPRVTHYTLGALFYLTHDVAGQVWGSGPITCEDAHQRVCDERVHFQLFKAAVGGLAAVCVVLMVLLVHAEVGAVGAAVAGALLLVNPLFRLVASSLVRETPVLLYSLLAFALLELAHRRFSGRFPFGLFIAVGLAAGLAVSCGLYAFPVYPAVLVAILLRGRARVWAALAACAVVVLVGLAVFYGTNPLLWQDLQGGLFSLTTGHFVEDTGSAGLREWGLLSYLASYPLLMVGGRALVLTNELPPVAGSSLPLVVVGWGLALWALYGLRGGRGLVPALWFAASVVWTGFIVVSRPAEFLSAKLFVLPAVALVWLVGVRCGTVATQLSSWFSSTPSGPPPPAAPAD